MKKKLLCLLICCCFLLGCGKNSEKDILKKLSKKINGTESYYLSGNLEIINNEDKYLYDVEVAYAKNEKFRVSLKNQTNNHEQIILRNDDGIYVLTPSLNKSFKFQSEWPYNNSQVYLLKSIIDDLETDSERTFEKKDNYYVFTSKVNYPNNKKLEKQAVYIDQDLNIKEVQVLDASNNVQIRMAFQKIDYKPKFSDKYFTLDENLANVNVDTESTETTSKIEDIIYPMYLPINTHLSSKEVINTESGERLILTFSGDSPFMLIEETATYEEEHTIIPTYGKLDFLSDTLAVINDNSINWISNGIEYYVVSDVVSVDELLEVARSISVIPSSGTK